MCHALNLLLKFLQNTGLKTVAKNMPQRSKHALKLGRVDWIQMKSGAPSSMQPRRRQFTSMSGHANDPRSFNIFLKI